MKKWILIFLLIPSVCWGGVNFDGTDDRIDLETVTNPAGNAFSFSCWIYPDTINAAKYILNANNSGGTRTFTFLQATLGGDGRLQFQRLNTALTDGKIVRTSTTLSLGAWYNLIITDDGNFSDATTTHIYINGVEASYAAQTTTGTESSHSGSWQLGARSSDNVVNYDGLMTECAYWNTVISLQDINLLVSSKVKRLPLQIKPANLLAYWPMDDQPDTTSGDGDKFFDLSSNNKFGTGNDGANNTGLTATAETVLTYP